VPRAQRPQPLVLGSAVVPGQLQSPSRAQQRLGDPGRQLTRTPRIEPDGSSPILALACGPGRITHIHYDITWYAFAVLQGIEYQELLDAHLNMIGERDNLLSARSRPKPLSQRTMQALRGRCGTRSSALAPDHPRTLETQYELAVALTGQGRTDNARAILDQVRQAQTRVLGPGHPRHAADNSSDPAPPDPMTKEVPLRRPGNSNTRARHDHLVQTPTHAEKSKSYRIRVARLPYAFQISPDLSKGVASGRSSG
jgi:hypothetical protein